jgi:hypothetical protein
MAFFLAGGSFFFIYTSNYSLSDGFAGISGER